MDGRSANKIEPLTKTVLEVPIPPPKPDGTKPDLCVTHLLGDYPLETHVFISLLHHKTLYVYTEKYIWRVNEGKIALMNLRKAALDEALSAYKKGDYAAAYKKLKFLALGDSNAQWLLGSLYEFGKGVPMDLAEAAKWYRYAAELGNPVGEFRVGMMCQKGEGVPQDYAEASMWLRKSAEKRFGEAQHNLGVMYANGQGVPVDYIQAHMWLSLAAAQGNADAQKELDSVARRMSQADIAEAQRLTREWKPKGKD
jgi:TPR repeat protein